MSTADVRRPRRAQHPRPPARALEVLRAAQISPGMRRVTLGGEELAGFQEGRSGPNVKVFVPREDQQRPVLPRIDSGTGRYVWPDPAQRPTMRTYTVRRYDAERAELDIDFVLHGDDGVAATWARDARPGDALGVMGPGGKTCRPAGWYLLAGDETALPAISALVESLPETARGQVFVEIAGEAEQQPVERPPGVTWTWLHRDGTAPGCSRALPGAVRAADIPADVDVSAWVAGESGLVRDVRRHLRGDRGLDAGSVLAIGYWKRGMPEPEYHDKHNHDRD
ncbi:siderophore-interacting protein [Salinifilum ghardaiensis]